MNAPFWMPRATIDDLYKTEGKAELIDGRIVTFMAVGHRPNFVAKWIVRSLDDWLEASARGGYAYTDSMGFRVPELASGRESFSPDASYYFGPLPANLMRFVEGPPTFAAEVRSANDYGPAQDREYAAKRVDYFEAGTLVVWDVDPDSDTVACYRAADPLNPQIFGPTDAADAEPAAPGWRVSVAWLMR